MLARRLIACLDVSHGQVVKGVNFGDLKRAGDPVALAKRYNDEGIDELVVLDISATLEGRRAFIDAIAAIARELFIPLTAGGGIRSLADARAVIEAGADKVSVNTAALLDPPLISAISETYGSQATVVAIDARMTLDRPDGPDGPDSYEVVSRAGTSPAGRSPLKWAETAATLGAGEILLTSIDRDGTLQGFDCRLTAEVSGGVPVPVIASGGAGTYEHFADVFTRGRADAALAASVFHFQHHSIPGLKQWLSTRNVPIRLTGERC